MRARLLALHASGELARLARSHGTTRQLAAALGVNRDALNSALERLRKSGQMPGWDALKFSAWDPTEAERDAAMEFAVSRPSPGNREPDTGIETPIADKWPSVAKFDSEIPVPAIPAGHVLRGASTLVDAEGQIKQQWIKTRAEDDGRRAWLDALRDMGGEMPRHDPTIAEAPCLDDLLTVYPVGDPHIGLLAWHEDAGENFDMNIAERNLDAAFANLTELAPASTDALMIYIGDNGHADSQSNQTTKGTRVDADGRTIKMARTILRIIRRNVTQVLAKHRRCRIIIERGNHDELISALIALGLSMFYENDPRVSVDVSPEMYHWFRFGTVLIGTHHGDKAKPMDLLGVMAVDRESDWSSTRHRRFYCGHYHHLMTKEVPGVIIEYLPTLAGSDAWHRGMGYRSQRAMYMDVYHRIEGHKNRHYVGIEQLTMHGQ